LRIHRRRRGQRHPAAVVDNLRVHVLQAPEDRQPRALRAPRHPLPQPRMALQPEHVAIGSLQHRLHLPTDGATGLAGLEFDLFIRVADPLAFVGVRRPNGTNPGRDLTDKFLIDPGDDDPDGLGQVELDAAGRHHVDRMRVPTCNESALPCLAARYPTPTISSSTLYPSTTPRTMPARRARVNPCRARWCSRSVGRLTTTVPSCNWSVMSGWRWRCRRSFGPLPS